MLRGDASGRVPFALVAVLLLMSAGMSALFAAKLAREEAAQRAHDARLEALARVAELVHGEVEQEAQQIGIRAVRAGTEGPLNESRIADAFEAAFAEYVGARFPRVVRSIEVYVTGYRARVALLDRRMEDLAPTEASRLERFNDTTIEIPDLSRPDHYAEVDRLAYHLVRGFVNYTLRMDEVVLSRGVPLRALVPVPAPLIAAKVEQATRAGLGDLSGVGRTAKAILVTLVQFRVLDGWASAARPGTTTRDVLTPNDVALAVNFALLLEEVRLFRAFDRAAAWAADGARGRLPPIPDDVHPGASERTLAHLLDTYAANGTLDPVDLYAVFAGLDARGLSMAAVLAQAIAALIDQLSLKALDYTGLTPLVDFLVDVASRVIDVLDGFLRWLTGRPSRQVEYVQQYLRASFANAGIGTGFFGPTSVAIPGRAYVAPSGNSAITISVPAHAFVIPFPAKDLLAREYDALWEAYFPRLNASVGIIGRTLRTMVNDFADRIATSPVLAGLIPESASGAIDPKDDTSFLAAVAARVNRAVDDAIEWVGRDPSAIETLVGNLWSAVRATVGTLVDHLVGAYDGTLVNENAAIVDGGGALRDDLWARAAADPDFGALTSSQKDTLWAAIGSDVARSGWVPGAYEARKAQDVERWRGAVDAAAGDALRSRLRDIVVGAGGWLVLARGTIRGMLGEIAATQDFAAVRADTPTRLDPFLLTDPRNPAAVRAERLRVRHLPPYLAPTPGDPAGDVSEGELRIAIADPATVPPSDDSPNVHYTAPFDGSVRPFTTEWSVRVRGAVRLRVETAAAVVLGPRGLEPVGVEKRWALDFAFSVPASSGWNLTGVRYVSSNTLAADAWRFVTIVLDVLWSWIQPIVEWVLGALKRALRVVLEILEPLLQFAEKVVRFLAKSFADLADFLRSVASVVVNGLGSVVDDVAKAFPANSAFTVHRFGLRFDVRVNGDGGRALEVAIASGAVAADLTFVSLERAHLVRGGERYDALARWDTDLGPFALQAAVDPLALYQRAIAEGTATWDGSWAIDFAGPVEERAYVVGVHARFTVPAPPIGDVEVELGVRAQFRENPVTIVEDAIRRALDEAIAGVGDARSWDDLRRIARTFVQRLAATVADGLTEAAEVQVYVQVNGKAGGAVGGGFRLAFVAEGRAVRALFTWLVANFAEFLDRGLDPLAPADYASFPAEVPEHVWVRVQGYFVVELPQILRDAVPVLDATVALGASVAANVAAIGVVLGQAWGAWEVRFGAFAEFALGRTSLDYGAVGLVVDVWLLQGRLHAA